MADADILVDLLNPGQVFACLGFLEAADVLLGDAEGGFDWSRERDEGVKFRLRARGEENPVETVLAFLAEAEPKRFGPVGYADPPPKKSKKADDEEDDTDDDDEDASETKTVSPSIELAETFLAGKGDRMALPIRLGGGNRPMIELGHWADGSSRDSFKLYSGNRSAHKIARAMLKGTRKKPSKSQKENGQPGDLKAKGITQLWEEEHARLIVQTFHVLTPMGGSFNFDPRGAWTAIDAGYSPNEHKHAVEASPVVEFLAALGLEHARPDEFDTRQARYAVWGIPLPPCLARVALIGAIPSLPMRRFSFDLDLSGKNKIVTFSQPESHL
jgi:CRISPR-associated protein Csx14